MIFSRASTSNASIFYVYLSGLWRFRTVYISHGRIFCTLCESLPLTTSLLRSQGKFAEAEGLYWQSQVKREKVLGPEHPDVAVVLNNWAALMKSQVRAV